MYNSIQHFHEFGVKDLEKVMVEYSSDMTKIAEMVYGVTESVVNLGLSIIAEEWEMYDEYLRRSQDRKRVWEIVRRDETTLLTSLGTITYRKTLFRNKETGEREYLLDRAMKLEKHARMTEDAEAKLLEEAVESSYRKGGEQICIGKEAVSKQTVMNKIRRLQFPETRPATEKKVLPYLYIDCDEDHVSLQYPKEKGDAGKAEKNHTVIPKLIYVYEGISDETKRHELINPKLFGGIYDGTEENQKLWRKVWDYIEQSYDVDAVKKIYINGDGAAWIKAGVNMIHKGAFVLDKFHMQKYIIRATSHLKDSREDARNELYQSIRKRKKWMAADTLERILNVTEGESKREKVEQAKTYILNNWPGIMEQMRDTEHKTGCSAEGHVSHVYSARMSSRPMGWSREGAEQMSRLRVYWYNKEDMLELVRYQKQEEKLAAGAEEVIFTASDMLNMERANRRRLGELADLPVYTIPYPQIKKIANFKNHIRGL